MKLKEIKKKIKGVFKQPVKKYYLGKRKYGTPYYWPWGHVAFFITLRRLKLKNDTPYIKGDRKSFSNFPTYARIKYKIVKFFGTHWYIGYGWPIKVVSYGLGWKDKFDTPRFEWSPAFHIFFFCWQFRIVWASPCSDKYEDNYWEQVLWFINYSDCNLQKAKETWPWCNTNTGESSWTDSFIINNPNLNLKDLERKLSNALANETKESLTSFILSKRK
jgi:hypothetical protein